MPVPDAVLLFAVNWADAQIHIEQTPAQIKDPHRLAPAFPPTNINRRTVLYVTAENIPNRLSQSWSEKVPPKMASVYPARCRTMPALVGLMLLRRVHLDKTQAAIGGGREFLRPKKSALLLSLRVRLP